MRISACNCSRYRQTNVAYLKTIQKKYTCSGLIFSKCKVECRCGSSVDVQKFSKITILINLSHEMQCSILMLHNTLLRTCRIAVNLDCCFEFLRNNCSNVNLIALWRNLRTIARSRERAIVRRSTKLYAKVQ